MVHHRPVEDLGVGRRWLSGDGVDYAGNPEFELGEDIYIDSILLPEVRP